MSVEGGGDCHVIRSVVCEYHSGHIGGAEVERVRADPRRSRRRDSVVMRGMAVGPVRCQTAQGLVMCCTWM